MKDNKYNSLHLGRKSAPTFALGHYMFLETRSFPRVTLSANCSLFETDDDLGQITSIFSRQMEAIVYVWRLFFICFDLADDLLFSYQVLALAQSLRGKLKIRFLPYDY